MQQPESIVTMRAFLGGVCVRGPDLNPQDYYLISIHVPGESFCAATPVELFCQQRNAAGAIERQVSYA